MKKWKNNDYEDEEDKQSDSQHAIRNDVDGDPLKGHKYELKFEYNAESKRSRRVLICKYEHCNKQFIKSWNIIDHFRIHTKESPFTCKACGKEFTQKPNLLKHMQKHLKEDQDRLQKFECHKCPSKYSSQYNLNIHLDREDHH